MMIPQDFLRNLATKMGVSNNEFEVLSRALQGEHISSISERLGVRVDALQKRLGEVYKKFHITGAGPGKFAKLQQLLITEYQKHSAAQETAGVSSVLDYQQKKQGSSALIDWGDAPDISVLYGRVQELITLEKLIIQDESRLVTLLGVGGVGKTTLAVRLVQQIEYDFDHVIWRSLANSPSLSELLVDLLKALSHQPEGQVPKDPQKQLSQVIKYLRNYRCLIILDQGDNIKDEDLEDYQEFFHRVVEANHKSCVVLTTWNVPASLAELAEEDDGMSIFELKGLANEDAKKVINLAKSFSRIESEGFTELIHLYSGNPFLLKLVTENLSNLVVESLSQFIKQTTFVMGNLVRTYLNENCQRISELEMSLLSWLAVHGQPVTSNDLKLNPLFSGDLSELTDALGLLERRNIVQRTTIKNEVYFVITYELRKILTHQLLSKYLNQLGHQKYLHGEFQTAKSYLKMAIRYNPSLAAAQYNLGATYEQIQDWETAKGHYLSLVDVPTNRAAHAAISNLARLDILEGQVDVAIRRIVGVLPEVSDPMVKAALLKNLGWAYLVQNRYDQAERFLRESIELDHERAIPHCLLAQVLELKGDQRAALEFWHNCLKFDAEKKTEGTGWRLPELDIWKLQAIQRVNSMRTLI